MDDRFFKCVVTLVGLLVGAVLLVILLTEGCPPLIRWPFVVADILSIALLVREVWKR